MREDYSDLIEMFSVASDRQISDNLSTKCRAFLDSGDSDHVRFLRNLRDLCVRYGEGSGFVMSVLNAVLTYHDPEPEEEMKKRREELGDVD